jgi:DMSO/TMAO reductase YedYZ heme-binding membrane subunit
MSIAERSAPTRKSLQIYAPSESVLLAIVAFAFLALHILAYYTLVRPALPEKAVDQSKQVIVWQGD